MNNWCPKNKILWFLIQVNSFKSLIQHKILSCISMVPWCTWIYCNNKLTNCSCTSLTSFWSENRSFGWEVEFVDMCRKSKSDNSELEKRTSNFSCEFHKWKNLIHFSRQLVKLLHSRGIGRMGSAVGTNLQYIQEIHAWIANNKPAV